jgi:chaperonin cofactor prefoldin
MNLMKLDIQLFAEGKVIIDVEADTKSFDAQIESLKKQLEIIDKQLSDPKEYGLSKDDIANLTVRAEKLNNQLTGLNAQKRKLEEAPTGFQKWLQNSGKEIEKNINKVKRWALAIFGIRSAYMAIRSAMSQITSEDSQIATDIEYMKWVLAQTLKPVVEWLVRALYTVLALINAISQSIFGINILAGKSAEDFKNMKKNAGGISGALKEAKKQLAGFDEMNVLQDTTSSGGAGSGFNMDDWEMPNMNEFNKNVEEAKNKWMVFGEEMRQSIEEMPFGIWLKAFGAWGVAVRGVTEFVYGLWEIVTGLVQFTKGALELIVGLTTNDTEKIKTAVFDMGDGIWKICDGLIHGILGLVQTVIGTIMGLLW